MSFAVLGSRSAIRATDVLAHAQANTLVAAVLAEQKWMVDASTGGRDGHRSAQLLYTPVDEAAMVMEWLVEHLPEAAAALGIAPFVPRRTEMQITVHGHGDFYKLHRDDQGDDVADRTLSYLYYLHRQPKAYQGGELVILANERVEIEPLHNSLVLFPSHLEHEVRRVLVPSGKLADGRISINGWLWR